MGLLESLVEAVLFIESKIDPTGETRPFDHDVAPGSWRIPSGSASSVPPAYPPTSRQTCATRKHTTNPITSGSSADNAVQRPLPVSLKIV